MQGSRSGDTASAVDIDESSTGLVVTSPGVVLTSSVVAFIGPRVCNVLTIVSGVVETASAVSASSSHIFPEKQREQCKVGT